jgi:hypothetical protein
MLPFSVVLLQQTHCHATVPVALLWKCYKDLTCHNIYVFILWTLEVLRRKIEFLELLKLALAKFKKAASLLTQKMEIFTRFELLN